MSDSPDSPVERELMPGVYVTDFRTANTRRAAAASASAAADHDDEDEQEMKMREEEEQQHKEAEEADAIPRATAPTSSSTNSSNPLSRGVTSTFPLDIPNDVETLELELEALEKNLMQLLSSNQILAEELKANPDDEDFKTAVEENRTVILRRSDRLRAVRQELALLAPHRVERDNAALQRALEEEQKRAAESASPAAPATEEGGLYL